MILCSFERHPRTRLTITCDHADQTCSFNNMPACRACYEAFRITWDDEDARFRAEIAACPDCQAASAKRSKEIQDHDTIDPDQPYGQHISLTCRNHPDLRWHTKNIRPIGCRSIFRVSPTECDCPIRDLTLTPTAE